MIKYFSCLLLLLFICRLCYSQQKIQLLNGKEIIVNSLEVKGDQIKFHRQAGNKEKRRSIDRYRVFSLTGKDGKEQVIYEPDTAFDMTVDQMRLFIQGEQAAALYYHKPMNIVGGVLSGIAGSYFTFYGLPLPLLYGSVAGRISPKVRLPEDAIYPDQKTEEFREGFRRKARDIKTKQTIISGIIGFAISVTFFSLYEGNVKF